MSAAAPAAPAQDPKPGKKKLVIIIVAVVVLLLALGGGAAFFLKKKNAAESADEAEGAEPVATKPVKADHGAPPAFVPLEVFIVNLADRDVERFAQIGITLQVADAHVAEELKVYMPAIRNAIIMILSHKTSVQLLTQEGKEQLAGEIRREAARSMGYEVEDAAAEAQPAASPEAGDEDAPRPKKKKKKRKAQLYNPIVHVHYSSFIIQ